MRISKFSFVVFQTLIVCALGLEAYLFISERPMRSEAHAYGTVGGFFRKSICADANDIQTTMHRISCEQTALFVMDQMPKTRMFSDRLPLLSHSLKSVGSTKGSYCEFGVAGGNSINHIARKVPHIIHGFDSFEGLPETWRHGFEKGTFAVSDLPGVEKNVKLYKGWFDKSLPIWAKENPGPIAFMHLDADLYSSTKTVFEILGDRIVPGTIIQFDEFFNYPGWQNGEYKAFKEFVDSRQIEFEYLGYARDQVAVRVLRVGTQSCK